MKKVFLKVVGFTMAVALIPILPSLWTRSPLPDESVHSQSTASKPAESERAESKSDEPVSSASGSDKTDPTPVTAYTLPEHYLVLDHSTGEVLRLPPLEYIMGVVAGEMPISFEPEALKAQAVAAHSYAFRQMGTQLQKPDPALKGAFLSTDPAHFQAYLSEKQRKERYGEQFAAHEEKLSEAVEAVLETFLMYEGEPAAAAFCAASGGKTEGAENVWGKPVPYLIPVDSPEDITENLTKTVSFTSQEAAVILGANIENCQLPGSLSKWITVEKRSDSGTVLTTTAGGTTVSGKEIREWFGLASANFTVTAAEEEITFVTKGSGHGVGMSQNGANEMAKAGKSWEEILTRYYPGTQIIRLTGEPPAKSGN